MSRWDDNVKSNWAQVMVHHLTEAVYRRYAIVSEEDIGDGMAKLAALSEEILNSCNGVRLR